MRIIVNPVDGSVLCMDSKRQDLGASNVTLDKVYGILVVIYEWKFTPTSSFDPKNGTVQAATGSIDGIPTFPCTKVPICFPTYSYHQRPP